MNNRETDKILNSTWSLGCHVLTILVCLIFALAGFRVLQTLPPMPEHPTQYVGADPS